MWWQGHTHTRDDRDTHTHTWWQGHTHTHVMTVLLLELVSVPHSLVECQWGGCSQLDHLSWVARREHSLSETHLLAPGYWGTSRPPAVVISVSVIIILYSCDYLTLDLLSDSAICGCRLGNGGASRGPPTLSTAAGSAPSISSILWGGGMCDEWGGGCVWWVRRRAWVRMSLEPYIPHNQGHWSVLWDQEWSKASETTDIHTCTCSGKCSLFGSHSNNRLTYTHSDLLPALGN